MEVIKILRLFRKYFWLGFGFKQIIGSLFFFLLTYIGQNSNFKNGLNNRVNYKNLDLSRFFFFKNRFNQT